MSKLIVALIFAGVLLLGSASDGALAQVENKEAERKKKTKETVAMSQQVYEELTEIQELVESQGLRHRSEVYRDKLKVKKGLSPYELAQIWNISAYSLLPAGTLCGRHQMLTTRCWPSRNCLKR